VACGKAARTRDISDLLAAQVDFSHAAFSWCSCDKTRFDASSATAALRGDRRQPRWRWLNMLRSNDLIWSYVAATTVKGQRTSAFDLLHWIRSDAMPARQTHSYYVVRIWRRLSTGSMVLDNTRRSPA